MVFIIIKLYLLWQKYFMWIGFDAKFYKSRVIFLNNWKITPGLAIMKFFRALFIHGNTVFRWNSWQIEIILFGLWFQHRKKYYLFREIFANRGWWIMNSSYCIQLKLSLGIDYFIQNINLVEIPLRDAVFVWATWKSIEAFKKMTNHLTEKSRTPSNQLKIN